MSEEERALLLELSREQKMQRDLILAMTLMSIKQDPPFLVKKVIRRAGKGCEIPNFKGSYLGRFPLVSADFWTSDHLSERSRSVDAFFPARARAEHSR